MLKAVSTLLRLLSRRSLSNVAPAILSINEGVAEICLNREKVHNALSGELVDCLLESLEAVKASDARILFLSGKGKSFSAGADLDYLKEGLTWSADEILKDSDRFSLLFRELEELQIVTVALVHGAAFAGGVGLVGGCDMTVATRNAIFSMSALKHGLVPTPCAAFLARRLGTHGRRFCLLGEVWGAEEAREIGLVNEVVDTADGLLEWKEKLTKLIRLQSPSAVKVTKAFLKETESEGDLDRLQQKATRVLTLQRLSEEGVEGVRAFLAKESPPWAVKK